MTNAFEDRGEWQLLFSKDKKGRVDEELYERCYHRVFTAVT